MDTYRKLYRRTVTFTCGTKMGIISPNEASLDAEQERLEKLACLTCRMADGSITDDDIAQLIASEVFAVLMEERQALVSRSRVN